MRTTELKKALGLAAISASLLLAGCGSGSPAAGEPAKVDPAKELENVRNDTGSTPEERAAAEQAMQMRQQGVGPGVESR